MKVLSLHTGAARDITATGTGEWWDKDWRSGFVKASQSGSVWLGYEGFSGDEQADRKHHGGVEKAVCVYPVEHYLYWQEVLPGLDLPHGAFGENLTTSGLLESGVSVGDVYQLGDAMVQGVPTAAAVLKLARRWRVKDLSAQVERTGYTGFYFRVLRHGHVAVGNELELKDRPWPQWTLQRCNEIMHHQRQDAESARQLAECPALSGSWKDNLWRRAQLAGAGGAGEAARRTARLEG